MTSANKSSIPALLALAVSAFAIGTTEFISVGLLPPLLMTCIFQSRQQD